jgi:hypothetical protein
MKDAVHNVHGARDETRAIEPRAPAILDPVRAGCGRGIDTPGGARYAAQPDQYEQQSTTNGLHWHLAMYIVIRQFSGNLVREL